MAQHQQKAITSKNRYANEVLQAYEKKTLMDGLLHKAIVELIAEREEYERQQERQKRALRQTIADRDAYISTLEEQIKRRNEVSV